MGKLKIIICLLFIFCVLVVVPKEASAARVAFTGFEWQSSTEFSSTSGTFSFTTLVTNPGGSQASLLANPSTTAVGWIFDRNFTATGAFTNYNCATCYYSFYFRYATKASTADEPIWRATDTGGTLKWEVRLNSSGNLAAYDSALALMATGATVLHANTWYLIEIKSGTGAAGAWEVKINGTIEISGTGSLGTNNGASARYGKTDNRNNNTVSYYYDDVWVDDEDYKGAQIVVRLLPDDNGSTMQWTGGTAPSDYRTVDEAPPSNTDYVQSTAQNDVALFDLFDSNTRSISGTINSVVVLVRVSENAAGTSIYNTRLRSNTTNSDNSTLDPSTTVVTNGRYVDTDPDTAAAWTTGGLDAVEIGGVDSGTSALRMPAAVLMVSFTPKKVTFYAPNNLDLVGHWPFNEGSGTIAEDFSGSGNRGTLTDGPTWTIGKFNQALSFDGVDDKVIASSTPDTLDITGNLTISAWIYPKSFGGGSKGRVLGKFRSNEGFIFSVDNANLTRGLHFGKNTGSGAADFGVSSGSIITLNQWQHVAVVWTGGATGIAAFYVNGVAKGTDTYTSGTINSSSGIGAAVGGNPLDNDRQFDGLIDEVRVYNRALSASNVRTIYRSSAVKVRAPNNLGLVGYWSMNDGAGTQAGDFSGNGNTGILTNGPTWTNGKLGRALSFDGSDDYVDLGTGLDQNGEITISAWIQVKGGSDSRRDVVTNGQFGPSQEDYSLIVDATTGALLGKWGSDATVVTGNTVLSLNTWYHAALVRSGSSGNWTAKIYLNGIQDGSGTTATDPNVTNLTTAIGRMGASAVGHFNGLIDEVRIYNRALSASEVSALYQSGAVKINP